MRRGGPRELARRGLRVCGAALMLLGALHLAASPHIPHLLDGLPARDRAFAVGPTLLNHLLVGVLLFPLGFTTWLAAGHAAPGRGWSRQVLTANAATVLTLPVLVAGLMRQPQYYTAPLFLAAVALSALLAASMALAVWIFAWTARV